MSGTSVLQCFSLWPIIRLSSRSFCRAEYGLTYPAHSAYAILCVLWPTVPIHWHGAFITLPWTKWHIWGAMYDLGLMSTRSMSIAIYHIVWQQSQIKCWNGLLKAQITWELRDKPCGSLGHCPPALRCTVPGSSEGPRAGPDPSHLHMLPAHTRAVVAFSFFSLNLPFLLLSMKWSPQ